MRRNISGFTTVELMVAVTIAAILLALAAPNFSDMLKVNRVQSQMRELYSQLAYARSEAVSRNLMVTVCRSNNATACGGTWSEGWIICVDNDRDSDCDVGEEILRKFSDLGQNTLKVVSDDVPAVAQASVSFKPDGSTVEIKKLTFAICDSVADVKYARAILKAGSGQLLMSSADANGIYKDVNGTALTCP